MRRPARAACPALLAAACAGGTAGGTGAPARTWPLDDVLRLQHVQLKGTHNSYHVAEDEPIAEEVAYGFEPLDVQLEEQDVRQFELDVHWDEETGELSVYHIAVFDDETSCPTLDECLAVLRGWSEEHPWHVPLIVLLEPKDVELVDHLDALDAAVERRFPDAITPDEVQGEHATLAEAIAEEGWPTLGSLRGRALFVLLDRGEMRDAYTEGCTTLAGRPMFSDCSGDLEAFRLRDDPGDGSEIRALVERNVLVRTRADAEEGEAESGDTTRRDTAIASGATAVSTDYPVPVDGLDYSVDLPPRCNPVTAPPDCTDADVE